MKYLMPIDITADKIFAVLAISLIEDMGHRIRFDILDILFLNTDLDWIQHLVNTRNTKQIIEMFENDNYSPYDVMSEQDIINKIFNGGI